MRQELPCAVHQCHLKVLGVLKDEKVKEPRARMRVEKALVLIRDIAEGRAGADHLRDLRGVAESLLDRPDPEANRLGRELLEAFDLYGEVFQSHILTRNCPTGECAYLTPAPCQMACPSGIDVPSYVALIGEGRYDEAVNIIRQDNPFPWVCGLVCTHPCEFVCVRAKIDSPIAIKDLKAFAAERALSEGRYVNPPKEPETGHKVCVVGAGPAGLTAAYFLALKGHSVTVIEALPVAGGMMMVGIPRFRLPREVIDREVALIEELGVEFRFNTRLGVDVTIDSLRREGFEAFFIAIGAHSSFKLAIPGEDLPQVIDAVRFLQDVAMGSRRKPGDRVIVVGGGNVAIDAARTLVRLGCSEVTLLYRRSRAEMPANVEEVRQAEEEGVRLVFLTIPIEVVSEKGRVVGLKCLRAKLAEADSRGRRRPIPVEGSDHILPADAVITAIGQRVDTTGLENLGLKWTSWDTIVADTITAGAGQEGMFAGGDVVLGPATVVEAIGAGKRAAEGIDRFLKGLPQPTMPAVPVRRARIALWEMPASKKMDLKRPHMPLLGPERRRVTFQQVELGLGEEEARTEAHRCLRCDICKRCGKCVAICRDKMGIDALELGYVEGANGLPTDLRTTSERCILCGACAANCPTGAMRIEDRGDERLLILCGTIMQRERLERCQECRAPVGPSRYLDYVRRRTEGVALAFGGMLLCEECARKATAQSKSGISVPER
jgi:putative selenate reductase YgfK subunit